MRDRDTTPREYFGELFGNYVDADQSLSDFLDYFFDKMPTEGGNDGEMHTKLRKWSMPVPEFKFMDNKVDVIQGWQSYFHSLVRIFGAEFGSDLRQFVAENHQDVVIKAEGGGEQTLSATQDRMLLRALLTGLDSQWMERIDLASPGAVSGIATLNNALDYFQPATVGHRFDTFMLFYRVAFDAPSSGTTEEEWMKSVVTAYNAGVASIASVGEVFQAMLLFSPTVRSRYAQAVTQIQSHDQMSLHEMLRMLRNSRGSEVLEILDGESRTAMGAQSSAGDNNNNNNNNNNNDHRGGANSHRGGHGNHRGGNGGNRGGGGVEQRGPHKHKYCQDCKVCGHDQNSCHRNNNNNNKPSGGGSTPSKDPKGGTRQFSMVTVDVDTHFSAAAEEVETGQETAMGAATRVVKTEFLVDTGATMCIINDRGLLHDFEATPGHPGFATSDTNGTLAVAGKGKLKITLTDQAKRPVEITLEDVVWAPSAPCLIMPLATERGFTYQFGKRARVIMPGFDCFNCDGGDDQCWVELRPGSNKALWFLPAVVAVAPGQTPGKDLGSGLGSRRPAMTTWTREMAHLRLGHINKERVEASTRASTDVSLEGHHGSEPCAPCVLGKQQEVSLGRGPHMGRPTAPRMAFWCDLKTLPHSSVYKVRYSIDFVDSFTKVTKCYFLRAKSEAGEALRKWRRDWLLAGPTPEGVVAFIDAGGELLHGDFDRQLREYNWGHHVAIPGRHSSHGGAEATVKALTDGTRALLADCNLSPDYWPLARAHFCYVRNRSTLAGQTQSPLSLAGYQVDLAHLRRFGCLVLAHVQNLGRGLQERAYWGVYVGHNVDYSYGAYEVLPLGVRGSKTRTCATITAYENIFPKPTDAPSKYNDLLCGSNDDGQRRQPEGAGPAGPSAFDNDASEEVNEEGTIEEVPLNEETAEPAAEEVPPEEVPNYDESAAAQLDTNFEPPCGEVENKNEDGPAGRELYGPPGPQRWGTDYLDPTSVHNVVQGPRVRAPAQYYTAMASWMPAPDLEVPGERDEAGSGVRHVIEPVGMELEVPERLHRLKHLREEHKRVWWDAIAAELEGFVAKDAFEEVDEAEAQGMAMGTELIFSVKETEASRAGKGQRRAKVRMVVRGDQEPPYKGLAKWPSAALSPAMLRVIIIVGLSLGYSLIQSDVGQAFLEATIADRDLYVKIPAFLNPVPGIVWKLRRSVYGLASAPGRFFALMCKVLSECGLKSLDESPCVFRGEGILVGLYVDDLLILSKGNVRGLRLVGHLKQRFSMTVDMEPAVFLGLEIKYDLDRMQCTLSQHCYVDKILARFNMTNANPTKAPGDKHSELPKAEPGSVVEHYMELAGSLIFLLHTRPDMAYAIKEVARHMMNQDQRHWLAAKRVLRYAKGTRDLKLVLKGVGSVHDLVMSAYVDAAHGNSPESKRSTTGLLLTLGPSPIYWRASTQTAVSGSSTEAEIVGVREALLEVRFLRRVLVQLGIEQAAATVVWTDSQGAMDNVTNELWQGRTRYMDIYARQCREVLAATQAVLRHCPGVYMPADVLTKYLPVNMLRAFGSAIRDSNLGEPNDIARIVDQTNA